MFGFGKRKPAKQKLNATPRVAKTMSLENVRANIIGHGTVIDGPFGARRLMYADYVASGRAYGPIEDKIRQFVLPLYANTHTESSRTGAQSTAFREQARAIIAKSIGAGSDDAVLFCGSGCTGAIDKFIRMLGLRVPEGISRFGKQVNIAAKKRPVVFIGPFEHHSNDVQWRETIAEVVTIAQTESGHIDLQDLEQQLKRYKARPLLIGSFSTASNVTGILCDPMPIAKLLHRYSALAAFDYAGGAPYLPIDMNRRGEDGTYMDAVFISPHKFLGGPGTPGVLALKKKWANNKTPVVPGGGTVSYVSPCAQAYHEDVIHREEGGTPDIVGAIRAGLCFDLQAEQGAENIKTKEVSLAKKVTARWSQHKNIKILGSHTAERLPIFSFLIRSGEQYLHYNFVVALLNDLFGIQARGGCSCAGPYGHVLLDIDLKTSQEYEKIIATGAEVLKPGWVRVGFNYFYNEDDCELIMRAVEWIADHGADLLPAYRYNTATGGWVHIDDTGTHILDLQNLHTAATKSPPPSRGALFKDADTHRKKYQNANPQTPCPILAATPKHLHWFAT